MKQHNGYSWEERNEKEEMKTEVGEKRLIARLKMQQQHSNPNWASEKYHWYHGKSDQSSGEQAKEKFPRI
jgi:hypothetical protein